MTRAVTFWMRKNGNLKTTKANEIGETERVVYTRGSGIVHLLLPSQTNKKAFGKDMIKKKQICCATISTWSLLSKAAISFGSPFSFDPLAYFVRLWAIASASCSPT